MKIYRFVARAGKQKKMRGIFKGLDFGKANIPDGEFEELMSFINSELPVPVNIPRHCIFYFTETGYKIFADNIEKLLITYFEYAPNYIKEWDIFMEEIMENSEKIVYQDKYQIAVKC